MRVLLDECGPALLARVLPVHECHTTQARGWAGIRNGELLALAESEYELFVTADQNVRYQQQLHGRSVGILELSTNNWRRIEAAGEEIRSAVEAIQPGELRRIDIPKLPGP